MESYHHDRCPVCKQRFLGCTDADMIVHFLEAHPNISEAAKRSLGVPSKQTRTCPTCNREYVTYQGMCPYCRHNGPPYE